MNRSSHVNMKPNSRIVKAQMSMNEQSSTGTLSIPTILKKKSSKVAKSAFWGMFQCNVGKGDLPFTIITQRSLIKGQIWSH
jgi:hypothetical protein